MACDFSTKEGCDKLIAAAPDTIDALLIAISEEYQDKGVNAMIVSKIGEGMKKNGIKYVESTRELEDNHNVQNIWGRFEHRLHKRARVYIKELQ